MALYCSEKDRSFDQKQFNGSLIFPFLYIGGTIITSGAGFLKAMGFCTHMKSRYITCTCICFSLYSDLFEKCEHETKRKPSNMLITSLA